VPTPTEKVQWLEAVVEQARGGAGSGSPVVTVHLPGGARLEIGDGKQAEMAALLLRALAKPC
jgi:hypothetical protein